MQGMSSGTLTTGGVFIFFLNGSPILTWFAVVCVVLGIVFLTHVLMKRRKEAREARGLVLPIRQGTGT